MPISSCNGGNFGVSREIPMFTQALFAALHRNAGYGHLALEQDPLMAITVSAPPYKGREDRIFDYARRFPNAFTFSNDQEIALIAGASSASAGGVPAVWGLDQLFGILHVLERLRPAARSAHARRTLEDLIAYVRPYEAARFTPGRRLISGDGELPPALRNLRSVLHAPAGSEADFLIEQLEMSLALYADSRAAQAGAPTKYRQTYTREENMKHLFMRSFRQAKRHGAAPPRVLVKAGHQHAIRGRNWSGVLSLGDFLSSLATVEGSRSFHLAVYMNNQRPGYYDLLSQSADYAPLAHAAPSDQSVVIDLQPLRALAYADRLQGLNAELRRVIFGFDAILLIANGERGSYDRSGGRP